MLYSFTSRYQLPLLASLHSLQIKEEDDPLLMSILGKINIDEARRRLANDNKAYIAYHNKIPAAFGWVASGKAMIGELNHEIVLPIDHRYLWNFRTLEEFRGLGIYPRLLQNIISSESPGKCFWILHAPENIASQKGIIKAGFKFEGQVSVLKNIGVIFESAKEDDINVEMANTLGFNSSSNEQATCWRCSSPYLKHKKSECCCSQNRKVCNQELFI